MSRGDDRSGTGGAGSHSYHSEARSADNAGKHGECIMYVACGISRIPCAAVCRLVYLWNVRTSVVLLWSAHADIDGFGALRALLVSWLF